MTTPRIFDSRFFWAIYTERDPATIRKLKDLLGERRQRHVSTITIYEVYRLSLEREGRDVAELRCSMIEKDMEAVDVNPEIAKEGAKISKKAKMPMADALIMATAKSIGAVCITNDPHFTNVTTKWI